jgi:hypothetical protein
VAGAWEIEGPGGQGFKGSRGMAFIGFVAFLGFVGLVKQGRVENGIPFTDNNSKNTTNPRNTINYIRVPPCVRKVVTSR